MYGRRIAAPLGEAASTARRLTLVGPPRSGKATLARTYVHRRHGSVMDLTDPACRERAAADIDGELARRTPPVAVLEHHLVEGLADRLASVQAATDATGSAWLTTSSRRSHTPPGTTRIFVGSLTLDERDHASAPRFVRRLLEGGISALTGWTPSDPVEVGTLLRRAAAGGFPELADPVDPVDEARPRGHAATNAALESLLTEGLLAAVRAASRLRHPGVLRELLAHHARVAGAEPGSDNAVARALAVSPPTVQRYRQLLYDHHLLLDLPSWPEAVAEDVGPRPRSDALVCDPGIAAHALGLTPETVVHADPTRARGLLLTLLAHDLLVQTQYDAPGTRLLLHALASGRRVLGLVGPEGRVIGVDAVATAPTDGAAVAGLQGLAATVGDRWDGGVLLAPVERVTSQEDVMVSPLAAPWQVR